MLNNGDLLILDPSTVSIHSCKRKHINKNKRSLTTAVKSLLSYYTTTNKPNNSNFLIPIPSIENLCSCKNKYTKIKNNNNM